MPHLQGGQVVVRHVPEDLQHLVFAKTTFALVPFAVLLLGAFLFKVTEPFKTGRNRDELLNFAVELGAELLQSGTQLQPTLLKFELALDVWEVLM